MESRNKLRDIQARKYINYLYRSLKVRDDAFLSVSRDYALKTLDDARNSDLYASIQNDIGHYEISAYEYLFYALTTDDVKTIDHHLLKNILEYTRLPHSLHRNLMIVAAALSYSRAASPAERKRFHGELLSELGADLTYENAVRPAFLNLAGVHISNLDCTDLSAHRSYSPNLSYCDLRGAEFTDCNFYYLKMNFSDISGASFTNVTNQYRHGSSDFHLHGSIAKATRFDHVTVGNNSWSDCNFSGARFNNSSIEDARLDESNFTDASFTNTSLYLERTSRANFTNTDFTSATLKRVNFEVNNFTNVRIIAPKSAADLPAEITRVTQRFMTSLTGSNVHVTYQLAAYQRIIAANVERYIKSLEMSEEDKSSLLHDVMQHDFFKYTYMEAVNSFVAEPFPRQVNTLVFYGNYDPDRYTNKLDETASIVYHNIYDYGMSVMKQFAEAARHPLSLDEWNQTAIATLQPRLETILHTQQIQGQLPPELRGKDVKIVMDAMVNQVDEIGADKEFIGIDNKLLIALSLSKLDVMIYGTEQMATLNVDDQSKIICEISRWHPLFTLRYNDESNCLSPYNFNENNGVYPTVAALIKEFTSDARLLPPVVAKSPSVSKVSATLFNAATQTTTAAPEQSSENVCKI